MALTHREFLRLLTGAGVGAALGCGFRSEAGTPPASVAESLRRAASFLADAQKRDKSWRSVRHGIFREGDVLTPPVLWALEGLPQDLQPRTAIQRGRQWLHQLTDDLRGQPEPWSALRYPLFTASYATRLCAAANDGARTAFWANLLCAFQISGGNDGWSDASIPPRAVPGADLPDMWNPNISATVCALEGLQSAERQAACRRALPFVGSCQNFAKDGTTATEWDDGGFFFTPDDPIRNKAGASGINVDGKRRFRSYGSATCDGLVCLLDCGLPVTDARVMAAIAWLQKHAGSDAHPGDWPDDRKDSGRSLAFYFAHAFSEALHRIFDLSPDHRAWCRNRMRALAVSLQQRQLADGSWANEEPESFEDDPVLATALALPALSTCAQALTGSGL